MSSQLCIDSEAFVTCEIIHSKVLVLFEAMSRERRVVYGKQSVRAPGTSIWEAISGGLIVSHGVWSRGEKSAVKSRGETPVGSLGDEVPHEPKHFCRRCLHILILTVIIIIIRFIKP